MQIKRYRVSDMQEALQKVKNDLGSEAIILSTRQVRGGGATFGLFGKPMLEVTAAREAPENRKQAEVLFSALSPATQAKLARTNPGQEPEIGADGDLIRQMISKSRVETQNMLAPLQDDISELKEILQIVGDNQRNGLKEDTSLQQMRTEMGEMRNLLQGLSLHSVQGKTADYPDNLVVLYQQLLFNGMEEKFARRLIEESIKGIPAKELEDFSYVKIFLARMLMKIVTPTGGIHCEAGKRKVVALIGPTGVGKTTTVAKLASEQVLKHKKRVALITVDTFRIAAVEQLKVYAKIMGVPITVVHGKKELHRAIEQQSKADVVFVDTGGRSQRDDLQMSEIYNLFGGGDAVDILLTLSATTKDADLTEITRRFQEIPLGGVIFTKLDESSTFGSVFNHAIRFKLPLAYLTTGQKVPEDIEVASRERLVDMVLNITEKEG